MPDQIPTLLTADDVPNQLGGSLADVNALMKPGGLALACVEESLRNQGNDHDT